MVPVNPLTDGNEEMRSEILEYNKEVEGLFKEVLF